LLRLIVFTDTSAEGRRKIEEFNPICVATSRSLFLSFALPHTTHTRTHTAIDIPRESESEICKYSLLHLCVNFAFRFQALFRTFLIAFRAFSVQFSSLFHTDNWKCTHNRIYTRTGTHTHTVKHIQQILHFLFGLEDTQIPAANVAFSPGIFHIYLGSFAFSTFLGFSTRFPRFSPLCSRLFRVSHTRHLLLFFFFPCFLLTNR